MTADLNVGAAGNCRQFLGIAERAPAHRRKVDGLGVGVGASNSEKLIDTGHAANISNFTATVNGQLTVSRETIDRSYYRPMDSLPKIVKRVEQRLAAVKKKAATASREAGLSASAIRNLQRGAKGEIATTGANARTFAALAPVLETTADWLMTGRWNGSTEPEKPVIRVKGYVGASAQGHIYAVPDSDLDDIPAPDMTESTTALEIKGDSLGSIFDRWYVVYDERREEVTDDMIGKLCVVGLPGDRVAVKVVKRSGKKFDLISQTGTDDIRNATVEWAARVKIMVPR